MFVIKGRILTINLLSEKSAQVILKKQVKGKKTAIAIDVFGFWKDKMEELHLKKNDKIKGVVYIKSNLYKGKYYTDIYFNHIELVNEEKNNKPIDNNLFNNETSIGGGNIICEKTGKILL